MVLVSFGRALAEASAQKKALDEHEQTSIVHCDCGMADLQCTRDGVACDRSEIGPYHHAVVFKRITKLKDDSGLFGES